MSIKLMSAIFDTELRDLVCTRRVEHKDGTVEMVDYTAKESTAKFVLLAIADHANDYGMGAYPGLKKLHKKTGLSKQAVIDTIEALRANGLLSIAENPSFMGTNDYTINIRAFPKMAEEAAELPAPVKPLDPPSQATLPAPVKPLDHNHPLTVLELNNNNESKFTKTEVDVNAAMLVKLYQSNIGVIVPLLSEKLIDAAKTYPSHLYAAAFEAAVAKNARNWAFVEACIRNANDGKEWQPQRTPYTPKKPIAPAPTLPNFTGYIDPNEGKYVPNPSRIQF